MNNVRLVQIREVNPYKGIVIGLDNHNTRYFLALGQLPPLAAIPDTGEVWRIQEHTPGEWVLVQRIEDGNEKTPLRELNPGDRRLEASNNIHLNGKKIMINGKEYRPSRFHLNTVQQAETDDVNFVDTNDTNWTIQEEDEQVNISLGITFPEFPPFPDEYEPVFGETVAELGAPDIGTVGTLMIDDDEWITLIYNGTNWVSQPKLTCSSTSVGFTTTSTTDVAIDVSLNPLLTWKTYVDAGLDLQCKLIGVLDNSSGGQTATCSVTFQSEDIDGTSGATATSAWSIALTGTTSTLKSSGWQDMPALTLHDILILIPVLKSSNGSNTAAVAGATIHTRWIG